MSISVSVYSKISMDNIVPLIDIFDTLINERYKDIFLIHGPVGVEKISKIVSEEYGFDSRSMFIISLNNKAEGDKVKYLPSIIEEIFDLGDLLILHNHETIMTKAWASGEN